MWYGTHAQANNQLAPRACASSSRGTASHSSTPFDGPRTHLRLRFSAAISPSPARLLAEGGMGQLHELLSVTHRCATQVRRLRSRRTTRARRRSSHTLTALPPIAPRSSLAHTQNAPMKEIHIVVPCSHRANTSPSHMCVVTAPPPPPLPPPTRHRALHVPRPAPSRRANASRGTASRPHHNIHINRSSHPPPPPLPLPPPPLLPPPLPPPP